MTIPNIRIVSLAAAVLLAVPLLTPHSAQAQLQKVEQTVFGMDCAPCAYALEQRMKHLDGVKSASVSLNEGRTTLTLNPDNDITLEQVRRAVQEAGFSPEAATVRVLGTLQRENGRFFLTPSSGERFRLQEDETATDSSNEMVAGMRVTLTGRVTEGETPPANGWALRVHTVEAPD